MSDNQLEKIKRLVHVRKHLNLTQAEFADILGINRANLSAIENGRENRKLPNGTTYIIEKELSINPTWFETGEGNMIIPPSENRGPLKFSDSGKGFEYKALPQEDGKWKTLYINSQEQVKLLHQQVELLNQIIKQ